MFYNRCYQRDNFQDGESKTPGCRLKAQQTMAKVCCYPTFESGAKCKKLRNKITSAILVLLKVTMQVKLRIK